MFASRRFQPLTHTVLVDTQLCTKTGDNSYVLDTSKLGLQDVGGVQIDQISIPKTAGDDWNYVLLKVWINKTELTNILAPASNGDVVDAAFALFDVSATDVTNRAIFTKDDPPYGSYIFDQHVGSINEVKFQFVSLLKSIDGTVISRVVDVNPEGAVLILNFSLKRNQ